MAHLSDDFPLQIPWQDQKVVRPHVVDSGHRIDRNVHSGRVPPMLVRIAIDCKIEEISANATIVEQRIAFAGGTISTYLRPVLLASNQKSQKLALRAMNVCGEPGVDPNVPKPNFALMSQQRIDARRYRMSAVLAAEIHA